MSRRRSALMLLLCLAASVALHLAWFGGIVWLTPFRQVASAGVSVSMKRPTPPRNNLGSGGEGDAILSRDIEREQSADEWVQDQPLLAIGSTPASASVPAVQSAVDAPELKVENPDLPGKSSANAMASLLAPPAPTQEANESPAAAAAVPGQADDRDSSPTSKTPSVILEARTGKTVSQDGLDFKLIGLRAGLTAMREGSFLPPDSRYTARIEVDDQGTPLKVVMLQSTGSDAVDQVLQKMLFNSWFDFPPGKSFEFTIVLR